MARYIRKGSVVNFLNNTESIILYGDIVKLSERIGVATSNINVGEIGSVSVEGVYEIPAENAETFTIGDKIYLNESGKATKTSGDIVAGWAIEDKLSSTDTAIVKI